MRRPRKPQPTAAPPGSREKLQVLIRRGTKGQPLFHSEDPTLDALPDDVGLTIQWVRGRRSPRVAGTRRLRGCEPPPAANGA